MMAKPRYGRERSATRRHLLITPDKIDDDDEEEEEEDEEEEWVHPLKRSGPSRAVREADACPYMGTIHRPMLDFDFEKICSQTLSQHHVYCCLVCGIFLQGLRALSFSGSK